MTRDEERRAEFERELVALEATWAVASMSVALNRVLASELLRDQDCPERNPFNDEESGGSK